MQYRNNYFLPILCRKSIAVVSPIEKNTMISLAALTVTSYALPSNLEVP